MTITISVLRRIKCEFIDIDFISLSPCSIWWCIEPTSPVIVDEPVWRPPPDSSHRGRHPHCVCGSGVCCSHRSGGHKSTQDESSSQDYHCSLTLCYNPLRKYYHPLIHLCFCSKHRFSISHSLSQSPAFHSVCIMSLITQTMAFLFSVSIYMSVCAVCQKNNVVQN